MVLRDELIANISKFEQQIRQVVVQSRGDTRLQIPNITITNPHNASTDASIVQKIDVALESWTTVIAHAIELEHQKMSKSQRTPLGEIEIWRERWL